MSQKIIDKIISASLNFKKLSFENGIRPDIAEIIEKRLIELRPAELNTHEIDCSLSFRAPNGSMVQNARFERSERGNIHLLAKINGFERKYVITPKRPEYKKILDAGFNEMPREEVKKYVQKFLIKKTLSL